MSNSPSSETSEPGVANNTASAEASATKAKPRKRSAGELAPAAVATKPTNKAATKKPTKADEVLKKLRSAKGVTIETLMVITGWQAHSVRGFLSGHVKKKLGLALASEVAKDGIRQYRTAGKATAD